MSKRLHLECWFGGWNPSIREEREPAGRGGVGGLLENRGVLTGDDTCHAEAPLAPDAEVAWPGGPFSSDSESKKLQIGFHVHECSWEEREDRKNNS